MLALTRRTGEAVRIGFDVEVKIVRVSGDRVKLAITAPPAVPVLRTELESESAPLSAAVRARRAA